MESATGTSISLFTKAISRSSLHHHGYPWLIHRLTYKRTNHHRNIHVRGYKEEGNDYDALRYDCP
jgi:phosphoketolase